MKRQQVTALHTKPVAELRQMLVGLQADLAKKRHEKRVGKLANVRALSRLTDDIARLQTIIRAQELAA
jgi:ribosomal protein L29